ncbi:MAG: hypothetical protein ABSF22_05720 [Bryobacteraceae bacterium]
MKRRVFIGPLFLGLLCFAGDRKQLPGQAGNDAVDLEASLIIAHDEITNAIGSDIGEGYVLAHVKVIPKGDTPLRIGPDDFTMISRKDGQRSTALAPSEIAGKGALIVKRGTADGGKTSWGAGGIGAGLGSSPGTVQRDVIKGTQIDDNAKEGPALAALTAKILPDKETKTPIEGLLYFSISGKLKPKDLAIVYKGEAGKLVMEFEPVKK